ncbi:MAG: sugar ABC transporter substrate-binding protein [Eubacteriales bacterium]|nr:sugar ABC transporter substrate-binding protein [Eubacteriales bacterium]
MKKLIALLAVLMMVISVVSGCAQPAAEEAAATTEATTAEATTEEATTEEATQKPVGELKIGIVMKSSDEFQNAVVQGAKDAAIEAGIPEANFSAVASTSESDAMQQVTAIEDMVANGIDILLNACQEENSLKGALQAAADAGVTVVMVDTDCQSFTDKVTFIGTDNYEAAYTGAQEFAKRLEAGSNVVILRGKLGDVNHEKRTEGLTAALEEAGMNVLEAQDANCETDKAAAAMEAFLTKYPGQIDAVMVTSDSMAVGAAQAIKSAGVEGIKICGFDGFQSAIQLVKTGEIEMIIAQQPYQMGYQGVNDALAAMYDGKTFDSYIKMGIAVIDSTNYQDYIAK